MFSQNLWPSPPRLNLRDQSVAGQKIEIFQTTRNRIDWDESDARNILRIIGEADHFSCPEWRWLRRYSFSGSNRSENSPAGKRTGPGDDHGKSREPQFNRSRVMTAVKKLLSRIFTGRPMPTAEIRRRKISKARLALESLDDRCLPSNSPLTLAANHNLMHGSTVVLGNVEQYQWSPATNMGFALQEGGHLVDYSFKAPTLVHASISSVVESIGLAADGTIYELLLGGDLQDSTNSGSTWTIRDTKAESFGVSSAGKVFVLDDGGQLRVSSNRGSTWTVLDS